jgi:hypothetical protein
MYKQLYGEAPLSAFGGEGPGGEVVYNKVPFKIIAAILK